MKGDTSKSEYVTKRTVIAIDDISKKSMEVAMMRPQRELTAKMEEENARAVY